MQISAPPRGVLGQRHVIETKPIHVWSAEPAGQKGGTIGENAFPKIYNPRYNSNYDIVADVPSFGRQFRGATAQFRDRNSHAGCRRHPPDSTQLHLYRLHPKSKRVWMDATHVSSCTTDVDHTTTSLFHARLRELYSRRIVVARDALRAQLELLQFDLRELKSAEEWRSLRRNIDAQLSACSSELAVERKSRHIGSSSSLTDHIREERYEMLSRRVQESALKLSSLVSELKSTLCASEQDTDAGSDQDVQQLLRSITGLVPSVQPLGIAAESLSSASFTSLHMSSADLEGTPAAGALSVESTRRSSSGNAINPEENEQPGEERRLNQGHCSAAIAKSFFIEELKLLRISPSGIISFQQNGVLQSLRLSELYRGHQRKLIIPLSYFNDNFSESYLGFSSAASSNTTNAGSGASPLFRAAHPFIFSHRENGCCRRFPFFQRRTYYFDHGRCLDELRTSTAPWCPDLCGLARISTTAESVSTRLIRPLTSVHESLTNRRATKEAPDASTSTDASQTPFPGYGYNGSRAEVPRSVFALSDVDFVPAEGDSSCCAEAAQLHSAPLALEPASGYGYNGFRVDAASRAQAIISNSNFQKRTILPSQTAIVGPMPEVNPDIFDVNMSEQPATLDDHQPSLTEPLDFLLSNSSNIRGPYFSASADPVGVVLPVDEIDLTDDQIFSINNDGSLSKHR